MWTQSSKQTEENGLITETENKHHIYVSSLSNHS